MIAVVMVTVTVVYVTVRMDGSRMTVHVIQMLNVHPDVSTVHALVVCACATHTSLVLTVHATMSHALVIALKMRITECAIVAHASVLAAGQDLTVAVTQTQYVLITVTMQQVTVCVSVAYASVLQSIRVKTVGVMMCHVRTIAMRVSTTARVCAASVNANQNTPKNLIVHA